MHNRPPRWSVVAQLVEGLVGQGAHEEVVGLGHRLGGAAWAESLADAQSLRYRHIERDLKLHPPVTGAGQRRLEEVGPGHSLFADPGLVPGHLQHGAGQRHPRRHGRLRHRMHWGRLLAIRGKSGVAPRPARGRKRRCQDVGPVASLPGRQSPSRPPLCWYGAWRHRRREHRIVFPTSARCQMMTQVLRLTPSRLPASPRTARLPAGLTSPPRPFSFSGPLPATAAAKLPAAFWSRSRDEPACVVPDVRWPSSSERGSRAFRTSCGAIRPCRDDYASLMSASTAMNRRPPSPGLGIPCGFIPRIDRSCGCATIPTGGHFGSPRAESWLRACEKDVPNGV